MKKWFSVIAIFLLALTSPAQVKITNLSRDGRLAWTNLAALYLPASPIYRVDCSSSPAGPWQTLTNTSQTSLFVTNTPRTEPAFYRVTWTNGQAWSYEGYSGQSLVAKGMLYLSVTHVRGCFIDGGSYYLAPGSSYRVGPGWVWPLYDGDLACDHLIAFTPDARDDFFQIDVLSQGSTLWTGTWHWTGFATSVQGTFAARRIVDEQ